MLKAARRGKIINVSDLKYNGVISVNFMQAYGRVETKVHIFLSSTLNGGRVGGTDWVGSWVCLKAGLKFLDKRKLF